MGMICGMSWTDVRGLFVGLVWMKRKKTIEKVQGTTYIYAIGTPMSALDFGTRFGHDRGVTF